MDGLAPLELDLDSARSPRRDALAAVLAWVDDEDERLGDIMRPYKLKGDELQLMIELVRAASVLVGTWDEEAAISRLELLTLEAAGQ